MHRVIKSQRTLLSKHILNMAKAHHLSSQKSWKFSNLRLNLQGSWRVIIWKVFRPFLYVVFKKKKWCFSFAYMRKCQHRQFREFAHENFFILVKGALSGIRQFLTTKSPIKMMKNAFCFTLKALLFSKSFEFLCWLFGHVEKWLD